MSNRSFPPLRPLCALLAVLLAAGLASAQTDFVAFESGQVRPLALSPNGSRLFAVNTPDNRLEVFDVVAGSLDPFRSIPVGIEPVAVAARTNTEVWVVNHLSDSVSIVDLAADAARASRARCWSATSRATSCSRARRRQPRLHHHRAPRAAAHARLDRRA